MASKESSGKPVCLVCLETHDTLKVVPACKHVFCRRCLSTHLESQGPSSESFPCPTCHVRSTLGEEGIDGLTDYDDILGGGKEEEAEASGKMDGGNSKKEADECGICCFTKGAMIKASTLCDECGQIYLCGDCTKVHAKNSATACHVVKSLKSVRKNWKTEDMCKPHKKQITRFCCTCSKRCCYLCVFLDHGNHDVKAISDAFRSLVDDLNMVTNWQEKRSNTLKMYEGQLKALNGSEVSKRRDILVQEIESHAEKCIEQIIQQKDSLKEEVLTKYKVVSDVAEWINGLPVLQHLDKIVAKAKRVLMEAEPHLDNLQQLSSMLQQVTDARIDDDIDEHLDGYWETYLTLLQNPCHFSPTNTDHNIGTITVKTRSVASLSGTLTFMYEKSLTVDNKAKFIPSVAVLGNNLFAVAHPVIQGQLSNAIDIYEGFGELHQTIRDHVPPFYDMVATTTGEIAVLSDGAKEGTCSVRVFDPDPEIGYIRSSNDFPVTGPVSFDIDIRHHRYAVLSSGGGKRVSLFNEDGSEVLSQLVDDVTGACRIRCSARNIFIVGLKNISVYEQKGKELVKMISRTEYDYNDISVSYFNEVVTEVFYFKNWLFLEAFSLKSNQLGHLHQRGIVKIKQGEGTESRLSVGDGYIVMSYRHAIRVYKV